MGFSLICGLSSVLGSNVAYSHRVTRVKLLQRQTLTFETDAQLRFSAERAENRERFEGSLDAFKAMIEEIAASNRPERLIEQIAELIGDEDFTASSLSKTLTKLVIELVSITNIDLLAYPGIFETGRQIFLAKLLHLASRIGLSRQQIQLVITETDKNGNHEDRIGEMERQVELYMQSPERAHKYWSIFSLLGFSANPLGGKDFATPADLCYVRNARGSLAGAGVRDMLVNAGTNVELIEDMWNFLNPVREALERIPVGLVDLSAEISVYMSALADISFLLNDPPEIYREVLKQSINAKLGVITPVLETHAANALSELSRPRSQLLGKIRSSLEGEARMIFEPLLVSLVDLRLANLLNRDDQGNPNEEVIMREISWVNILIEGFIEAIQRGEARISAAELLVSEISKAKFRGPNVLEGRHMEEVVETSFQFASRLNVRLMANRPQYNSERIANLRLIMAACLQLRCDSALVVRTVHVADAAQLSNIVAIVSRMVARRNFYLSLNQDELVPVIPIENYLHISASLAADTPYTSWVAERLAPLELLRRRGFLGEQVREIITHSLEFPNRLMVLANRVAFVCGTTRRKIGGTEGEIYHRILSRLLRIPGAALQLEVSWGVLVDEAVDPADLVVRHSLETVFMDLIDLVGIVGRKFSSMHAPVDGIMTRLENIMDSAWWLHANPAFVDLAPQIAALSSEITQLKAVPLLA